MSFMATSIGGRNPSDFSNLDFHGNGTVNGLLKNGHAHDVCWLLVSRRERGLRQPKPNVGGICRRGLLIGIACILLEAIISCQHNTNLQGDNQETMYALNG